MHFIKNLLFVSGLVWLSVVYPSLTPVASSSVASYVAPAALRAGVKNSTNSSLSPQTLNLPQTKMSPEVLKYAVEQVRRSQGAQNPVKFSNMPLGANMSTGALGRTNMNRMSATVPGFMSAHEPATPTNSHDAEYIYTKKEAPEIYNRKKSDKIINLHYSAPSRFKSQSESPLLDALIKKDFAAVKTVIEQNPRALQESYLQNENITPLDIALTRNKVNEDLVEFLLNAGINPDSDKLKTWIFQTANERLFNLLDKKAVRFDYSDLIQGLQNPQTTPHMIDVMLHDVTPSQNNVDLNRIMIDKINEREFFDKIVPQFIKHGHKFNFSDLESIYKGDSGNNIYHIVYNFLKGKFQGPKILKAFLGFDLHPVKFESTSPTIMPVNPVEEYRKLLNKLDEVIPRVYQNDPQRDTAEQFVQELKNTVQKRIDEELEKHPEQASYAQKMGKAFKTSFKSMWGGQ
jgi:hypothetical protein